MTKKVLSFLLAVSVSLAVLGCPSPTTESPGSTNAKLSALTVNDGVLSPAFAPGTTAYTVSVPNATTEITVTGTKDDRSATVSPNSGAAQSLIVGSTEITIAVTAEDGTTVQNYVVTVHRAESSDANLSALAVKKEPTSWACTT
jgi:hypothetical protein